MGDYPDRAEQSEQHAAGRVVRRACYLATKPDPIFAVLHLQASSRSETTAVLLCPPFGWDDINTYRIRRVWADAFASAGHPALRIDLPVTNDSAGSPQDPSRLAASTSAAADPPRWLRAETGCSRIDEPDEVAPAPRAVTHLHHVQRPASVHDGESRTTLSCVHRCGSLAISHGSRRRNCPYAGQIVW
jgi:hypothetical protein